MVLLTRVEFVYEDGSVEEIVDPRACKMFQSRINSSGIVAGMGEYLVAKELVKDRDVE